MIKAPLSKLLAEQPKWLIAITLVGALLLAVDFYQRIKVSVGSELSATSFDLANVKPKPIVEISWSEPMLQWLASFEKQNEATTDTNALPVEPPAPPMPGASALGELQVRVRGIFKFQAQDKADFALIESYNQQDRKHQISRYELGSVLGNYTISALQQNAVEFKPVQQNANNNLPIITIRVFGKTSTN